MEGLEKFEFYLSSHIKDSKKLFPNILDLKRFFLINNNIIYVDLNCLRSEYIQHYVNDLNDYAENFLRFSARAMSFGKPITVFSYVFKLNNQEVIRVFNINDFRTEFLNRIQIAYPVWKLKLNENNEIDLTPDYEVSEVDKHHFRDYLHPILHKLMREMIPVSTRVNLHRPDGWEIHHFSFCG